jgi:hypothetical protein
VRQLGHRAGGSGSAIVACCWRAAWIPAAACRLMTWPQGSRTGEHGPCTRHVLNVTGHLLSCDMVLAATYERIYH